MKLRLKEKLFNESNTIIFGALTVETKDNLKNSLEILNASKEISLLDHVKNLKARYQGLSKREIQTNIYAELKSLGYSETDIKLYLDKTTKRDYSLNVVNIYTLTATKSESKRYVQFEKKSFDAINNIVNFTTISKVETFENMELEGLRVDNGKDINKKDMKALNEILESIETDREVGISIRDIKEKATLTLETALTDAQDRVEKMQAMVSAWDTKEIISLEDQRIAEFEPNIED